MEDCKLELQFEGYEIEKIILNKSHEISDTENDIGFLFKIATEKVNDFEKVNIIEGVLIEPSQEFGYKLEVIIRGNFRITKCKDDKEKYAFLFTNASAIMFPYLRAVVSMISSQIEYENVVLPVMNFYKVFEEEEIESFLLDCSQYVDFD